MKNYSRLMKLAEKWFKLGTEGCDYLIRPNLLTSTLYCIGAHAIHISPVLCHEKIAQEETQNSRRGPYH